ncbi:MAG: hypothetical protein IPM47_05475 [Sphingobacteriales bacterium]|nr:MAG: hypothetical protein IPM47_05475 [Sphingobacteriales bacterium]
MKQPILHGLSHIANLEQRLDTSMDTTICSYYDPVIKKRRKKTGAMLGKITESDGFIASDGRKKKICASDLTKIAVREFRFTDFLEVSAN